MLVVQSLAVRADRIVCMVRVDSPFPRMTSPELVRRVLERFPDLPRHACVNDQGATFAACMDATPTPHLLEHMVIDCQLEELAAQAPEEQVRAASLKGSTHWVNWERGTARIEVSYWDDLVALRCFTRCVDLLNSLV